MRFLALIFLPLMGFGQINLDHKVTFQDERVEIMVPGILSEMKDEVWKHKYQDIPKPQRVLTDEQGEVNLLINATQQPINPNELFAYEQHRIDQLRGRSDIKILGEGVKTVSRKKVGFIKFLSQSSDRGIFNFYFFTEFDGKVLFFSFNCNQRIQKSWEKTAEDILNSLRIN